MTIRIACCVPHCPRTRGDRKGDPVTPDMEWICGDHWRMADKRRRKVWGRVKGRWRRFGPDADRGPIDDRLWRALKRQAINRAFGIG